MIPFATWNAERDVWETNTLSLFSEHLDVYSETWPASGSMRNGTAYERPTSEHPTVAPGTSLSPSPAIPPAAPMLLPTPRTSDTNGAGMHGSGGPDLRTVIVNL